VRLFLKHPDEMDRLRDFILHPCPFDGCRREEGWAVDNGESSYSRLDKPSPIRNWETCCESEDILLRKKKRPRQKKGG